MKLDDTTASLWRLARKLTIVQAAILMIEGDPSQIEVYWDLRLDQPKVGTDQSRQFLPAFCILKEAAEDEGYQGLSVTFGRDESGYRCWDLTTVSVDELREFLHRRGMRGGFFALEEPASISDTISLVQGEVESGFLKSQNTFYAPELALAVSAWEAVTQNHSSKRSPKDNLREWIERNWQTVWTDSSAKAPSKEAVERIATLANWKPAGGAPKSGG